MKLTDNARFWWRFWSVRLSAVGALVMGVLTAWPDSILYLWGAMPAEVRSLIPQQFVTLIAMFIFVMSAVSRIVKQKKIENLEQQARVCQIKGLENKDVITGEQLQRILDDEKK